MGISRWKQTYAISISLFYVLARPAKGVFLPGRHRTLAAKGAAAEAKKCSICGPIDAAGGHRDGH